MKKRIGYTLVELVVVIALLAIIMLMTIPNTGLFKALSEDIELKEFKRDVHFARNKAIIDSRIYTIKFLYEENGYRIQTEATGPSIKIKHFKSGLKLTKERGIPDVKFNSNGTITNSGTIYFSDRNDKKYKMTIPPVRGLIDIKVIDSNGGELYGK